MPETDIMTEQGTQRQNGGVETGGTSAPFGPLEFAGTLW